MDNIQLEQQFDLSNTSCDGLRLVLSTANDEIIKYTRITEDVSNLERGLEHFKNELLYLKGFNLFSKNQPTHTPTKDEEVFWSEFANKHFGIKPDTVIHNTVFDNPLNLLDLLNLFLDSFLKPSLKPVGRSNNNKKKLEEVIKLCEEQLPIISKKARDIAQNEFKALYLIPEDYAYEYALTTMLKFIDSKRADGWKEVTALYEEHLYRMKMEDAAKETAENSRLQAEYARQTRNATRSAAAGAWASAAGIFLRR